MRSVQRDQTYFMQHQVAAAELSRRRFESCHFDNCTLRASPGQTISIRDLELVDCSQRSSALAGAVLDEVVVDGLRNLSDMPLFLEGVVFRHVTLRGRIAQFKINPAEALVSWDSPEAKQALAGQRRFYAGIDWALDIREASFTFGPDLQFVPGRLVRFDPSTQALVHRAAFAGVDPSSLPWEKSALEIGIQWFLEDGPYEECVIVAPKKSKAFKRDLAAIEMLRARGLADLASGKPAGA
ncbi:MAG: hypothetical protein NDJ92_13520 [Thermoanaerobaculia bacterium]|nr:hypothetical protein [Thermoanaerobaculia bacterium]